MSAALSTEPNVSPALVLFGRDEAGKPHASSFLQPEVTRAREAAGLMGMRVLPIKTDVERALAQRVPKGKLFASGKGFVPYVRAALFQELERACPQTEPSDGSRRPRAADGEGRSPTAQSAEPKIDAKPAVACQPSGWGEISLGAIVLTLSSPDHAEWYEAQVTGIRGDRFTLRFCDFPKRPAVERGRQELGLLHPKHEPAPPLEI